MLLVGRWFFLSPFKAYWISFNAVCYNAVSEFHIFHFHGCVKREHSQKRDQSKFHSQFSETFAYNN